MTRENLEEVVNNLRNAGNTDEEIGKATTLLYLDGEMSINDFERIVNILGYVIDDEFKNMTRAEQRRLFFEGRN